MDKAFIQHDKSKEMNVKEFPWENYLYYDSKHILPIICHRKPLTVEQQILSAYFLRSVVEDGSIS